MRILSSSETRRKRKQLLRGTSIVCGGVLIGSVVVEVVVKGICCWLRLGIVIVNWVFSAPETLSIMYLASSAVGDSPLSTIRLMLRRKRRAMS